MLARSIKVKVGILERVLVSDETCCYCLPAPKFGYSKLGDLTVEVTEGDFGETVREAVLYKFQRSAFVTRGKGFTFAIYSSESNPIVSRHARFETDGQRLFVKGLWRDNRLECCDSMTAVVEYATM